MNSMTKSFTSECFHLLLLGLSTLVLVIGCAMETDGQTVFLGQTALPSTCWLRDSPLRGCPGCGLTRSVIAFCHWRWQESFDLHPAGSLLVVLVLVQVPYHLAGLCRARMSDLFRWGPAVGRLASVTILGLSVVNWLERLLV